MTKLGFQLGKFKFDDPQLFDPTKKQAIITVRYQGTKSKSLIFQHDKYNHCFKFMEDDFFVWKIGIAFERNFIHFKLFRDEIEKLFESGILKSQERKVYQSKKYKNSYKIVEKEIQKRVLTFDDLKAGFVIWLAAVLASSIVFIFEIICFQMSIQFSSLKFKKNEKKKNQRKVS